MNVIQLTQQNIDNFIKKTNEPDATWIYLFLMLYCRHIDKNTDDTSIYYGYIGTLYASKINSVLQELIDIFSQTKLGYRTLIRDDWKRQYGQRDVYLRIPDSFIADINTDYITWANTDITPTNDIVKIFKTQLFRRYNLTFDPLVEVPSNEECNIKFLGDTIAVRNNTLPIMVENSRDHWQTNYNSKLTMSFFNPNLANIYGGELIDIGYFIENLGFKLTEVKNLLLKISKRQIMLNIIGMGGTMSNFLYWTYRLHNYFNLTNPIFEAIRVYDNDTLELSNLFRIPLDWGATKSPYKADLVYNHQIAQIVNMIETYHIRIVENTPKYVPRTIWIGTPDIKTRKLFTGPKVQFLCPLHRNDELVIWRNPKYSENEVVVESYGTIKLEHFFINMIRMTLILLQHMTPSAKNEETLLADTKFSDIKFQVKNKLFYQGV